MTQRCSLIIPAQLQARILSHLFPGDHDEHGLIIVAGVHQQDGHLRLLARDVHIARDGIDYVAGRYGYRMLRAEFIQPVIRRCRQERLAYVAVHNHGGDDSVAFSRDDLRSHERGYPALLDLAEGLPVGAAVYARRAIAGDIWMPDGTRLPLAETRVLGTNIERLFDSPRRFINRDMQTHIGGDAHARQVLMFGEAGQRRLREATIGVIGAGGVGSLLIEYLARLGIGRLVIADKDYVDVTNLSRIVGATHEDATHKARKVNVAQRLIMQANPRCEVEPHDEDFAVDAIARQFLTCDFLFLAADSMRARLVFNAIVNQYFIPGIQIGSKVVPGADPQCLDHAFSVERWVLPGTNCLWCAGMISPHQLALEAKTYQERRDQDYGTGAPNPSIITINAIGASHAVNDFMMSYLQLHQATVAPNSRRFRHTTRDMVDELYTADPDCPECSDIRASRFGRGDATALPTIDRIPSRAGVPTMSKKDVHTVPNPSGKGWVNKVGGEVTSRHRTQENAADRGREIARENRSEHAIHRRDGTIGEKNSYGNDPNPPRDKNR